MNTQPTQSTYPTMRQPAQRALSICPRCKHPTPATPTTHQHGLCKSCSSARHAGINAGRNREHKRLYNSRRWKRLARDFLDTHRWCIICHKPATETDHKEPHRGNDELFWNEVNLQPLCHICHSRKTMQEQRLCQ